MNNEEKLKKAFWGYIRLSGLWDKIKDNLAFKIDAVAKAIYPASFIGNTEYVTWKINAIYTYFDPDNSNIIWQETANFEETWLERAGEFVIGDKGITSPEYSDARATNENFFSVLSTPLIELLCYYFNIDKTMLITNADSLISLNNEIFIASLELERIKKSIEQKKTAMENLTDEINKDNELQSKALGRVKELRKNFSLIVKN